MMKRKNNVVMKESYDNVDHNNVVIIWFGLCLEFFLEHA